jgi:hypothetical protein
LSNNQRVLSAISSETYQCALLQISAKANAAPNCTNCAQRRKAGAAMPPVRGGWPRLFRVCAGFHSCHSRHSWLLYNSPIDSTEFLISMNGEPPQELCGELHGLWLFPTSHFVPPFICAPPGFVAATFSAAACEAPATHLHSGLPCPRKIRFQACRGGCRPQIP